MPEPEKSTLPGRIAWDDDNDVAWNNQNQPVLDLSAHALEAHERDIIREMVRLWNLEHGQ